MDQYLVTGGAGFIGSNLVEELLRQGEKVRVLDNFSTGHRDNIKPFSDDIEVVEGDIRSLSTVYRAVDGVDYFLDDILPLIQSKISDVRVSIVGKSPTPNLVKKSQENSNIKIEGYVDDIRPYVDKAAIFIAPIRSGSGTKIKILNALS